MEDTKVMGSLGSDGDVLTSDADDEADEDEDEGYVDQAPSHSTSPMTGGRDPLLSLYKLSRGPSLLGQHFYTPQGRALLRSHSWDEQWYSRVVKQVADKACSLKTAGMTCPFCSDSPNHHNMDIFDDEQEQASPESSLLRTKTMQSNCERGMPLIDTDRHNRGPSKGIVKPVPRMGVCASTEKQERGNGKNGKNGKKKKLRGKVPVPPERFSSKDTCFRSLAMVEATSVPELSTQNRCLPPDNIKSGTDYLLQRFLDNIEEEAMLLEVIDDYDYPPMEPRTKLDINPNANASMPRQSKKQHALKPKASSNNGVSITATSAATTTVQGQEKSDCFPLGPSDVSLSSEDVFDSAVPSRGRKRSRNRRCRSRHRRFLSTCHVFRSAFLQEDGAEHNDLAAAKTLLATTSAHEPPRVGKFSTSCELPQLGCLQGKKLTIEEEKEVKVKVQPVQHASVLAAQAMQEHPGRGKYSSCYEIPQLSSNQCKEINVQGKIMQHKPQKSDSHPYRVSKCTIALRQTADTDMVQDEDQVKVSSEMLATAIETLSPGSLDPALLTYPYTREAQEAQESSAASSTIRIMALGQVELSMSTTKAVSVFGKSTGDVNNGVEFSIQVHDQLDAAPQDNGSQWGTFSNCASASGAVDYLYHDHNAYQKALADLAPEVQGADGDNLYCRQKFLRSRAVFTDVTKSTGAPTPRPGKLSASRLRSAQAMLLPVLKPGKNHEDYDGTINQNNRDPPGLPSGENGVKLQPVAAASGTGHQLVTCAQEVCGQSSKIDLEPILERPVYATVYQAKKETKEAKEVKQALPWQKVPPPPRHVSGPLLTKSTAGMNLPRCFGDKRGPVPDTRPTASTDGHTRTGDTNPPTFPNLPASHSYTNAMMPDQDPDLVDLKDYFSIRYKVLEAKHLMDEVFDVINKNGKAAGVESGAPKTPKKSQAAIHNNISDVTPVAAGGVIGVRNARGPVKSESAEVPELSPKALHFLPQAGKLIPREPAREQENRQCHVPASQVTETGTETVAAAAAVPQNTGGKGIQNNQVSALGSSREIGAPGANGGGAPVAMYHYTQPQPTEVCKTFRAHRSHGVENEAGWDKHDKPTSHKYAESKFGGTVSNSKQNGSTGLIEHAPSVLTNQSLTAPDKTEVHQVLLQQTDSDGLKPTNKSLDGEDTEVSTILREEIKMATSPDDVMPTSVYANITTDFGSSAGHDLILKQAPGILTADSNVQTDSPDGWILKHDLDDGKPLFRPIVAELSLNEITYG